MSKETLAKGVLVGIEMYGSRSPQGCYPRTASSKGPMLSQANGDQSFCPDFACFDHRLDFTKKKVPPVAHPVLQTCLAELCSRLV